MWTVWLQRILITLNINLQKIFQDIMTASGVDPKEYQDEIQEDGKERPFYDGSDLYRYDGACGRGKA